MINEIVLGFEINSQNLEKNSVEIWLDIEKYLSNVIYLTKDGECHFKINWQPLLNSRGKESHKTIKINCTSTILAGDTLIFKNNFAVHILQNFLYDVFFVSNISKPSVCDFGYAKVPYMIEINKQTNRKIHYDKLGLDNSFFHIIDSYSDKSSFFENNYIPVNKVWSWYKRIFPSIIQVAETSLQRAIFSVLEVSKFDQLYTPISTIWLCQAIESLYNVPDGSVLRQRICKFLNVPESNIKKVSNELREAFKLRHSFMHGGGAIPHPSYNEVLDPTVDNIIVQQMDTVSILGAVVIGTLRQMAIRNWINLSSSETIEGY